MIKFDQVGFFQVISQILPPHMRLAKWVQEALEISTSTAYARIDGGRAMDLNELLTLCGADERVGMRTAEMFVKHNLKVVQLEQFRNEAEFARYLRRMHALFNKALTQENFRLRYVARDLPIFFFFSDPLLLRMKFKQWTGGGGTILPLLSAEVQQAALALFQQYLQMPTEELWHGDAFASQVRQVHIQIDRGLLNAADGALVLAHLQALEAKQAVWTQRQCKPEGGALLLTRVEELPMTNGALLEYGNIAQVLGSVLNAHYYKTENPGVISSFRQQWKQYLQWAPQAPLAMLQRLE